MSKASPSSLLPVDRRADTGRFGLPDARPWSHSEPVARLRGWEKDEIMGRDKTLMALAVVVLLHLGVVYAHGSAHAAAGVDLPPAALAFALVAIGIGVTVFVAGGSGTIGLPLVRALVAGGHEVFATTRSPEKREQIGALGATPVVVDALDASALEQAARAASPSHVIHQLTALPKTGPRRASDLTATNRLRDEGTRNLLRAAVAAGAARIVGGSFAMLGAAASAAPGDAVVDPAVRAVRSMESQLLDAARRSEIEAIVLRYGLFYGPSNPATREMIALVRRRRLPRIRDDRGQLPFIHLDDAVAATVAALDRGSSGGVYDIVDDRPTSFSEMVAGLAEAVGAPRPWSVPAWLLRLVAPYTAGLLAVRLPLSNAGARRDLGWSPAYPSYREGLRQTLGRAA
jgi:nucleoside-diphosphate-sugar epimerase